MGKEDHPFGFPEDTKIPFKTLVAIGLGRNAGTSRLTTAEVSAEITIALREEMNRKREMEAGALLSAAAAGLNDRPIAKPADSFRQRWNSHTLYRGRLIHHDKF